MQCTYNVQYMDTAWTVVSFPDTPHVAYIVLTFELARTKSFFCACEFKGQYYIRGESLGTKLHELYGCEGLQFCGNIPVL